MAVCDFAYCKFLSVCTIPFETVHVNSLIISNIADYLFGTTNGGLLVTFANATTISEMSDVNIVLVLGIPLTSIKHKDLHS